MGIQASQKFASGGCGYVYTQAISKTKNPIYKALKSKARQLKKISYSGPKGIIICDGGSDMFHAKPSGSFRPYFNASEVIKEFLRQHKSIDFILMLSSVDINSRRSRVNMRRPFRFLKSKLWYNSKSTSWNPFEYFLNQRMRIVEIKIEDRDDFSYLIFKFDGPDSVISSFINPKANLDKNNNR